MFKKPLLLSISALVLSCSNSIELVGILDKVEVLRDNYGINHIYANNQNDVFFICLVLSTSIKFPGRILKIFLNIEWGAGI